jgi:hypothetical protein
MKSIFDRAKLDDIYFDAPYIDDKGEKNGIVIRWVVD